MTSAVLKISVFKMFTVQTRMQSLFLSVTDSFWWQAHRRKKKKSCVLKFLRRSTSILTKKWSSAWLSQYWQSRCHLSPTSTPSKIRLWQLNFITYPTYTFCPKSSQKPTVLAVLLLNEKNNGCVQECYNSCTFICSLLQNDNVKWPNSTLCEERKERKPRQIIFKILFPILLRVPYSEI